MAIAKEKSIVGTLRLVLVNIVTAGQVVIVGLMMFSIANVIISGCGCPELRLSDFACRLFTWVIASGGAARLMYMTTFAISVYIMVRYGAKKMKIWVAVVAVVGVWVGALLPNAAVFSPDVVLINFHDNVTCAAHGTGYKTFIYAFGYISMYGLLGFAVSVFSPIATAWFIQHNTISGDITLMKAMLKFAVFLILGNVINFFGQTTPLFAFCHICSCWKGLVYFREGFQLCGRRVHPPLPCANSCHHPSLLQTYQAEDETHAVLCVYEEGRQVGEEQNWHDSYWQRRQH